MRRAPQVVLILSISVASWLGMMAVHELGHVLGAWWTCGTVAGVVLHPLTISRTDVSHNPRPLFVAWSGPAVGVMLPLAAWAAAWWISFKQLFLVRFFAGFCLVANGAYIGGGSFAQVGDCGDLLRHGAAVWQLWLFGGIAVAAGLGLWNGLARHFGFAEARGRVDQTSTRLSAMAAIILLAIGFLMNGCR